MNTDVDDTSTLALDLEISNVYKISRLQPGSPTQSVHVAITYVLSIICIRTISLRNILNHCQAASDDGAALVTPARLLRGVVSFGFGLALGFLDFLGLEDVVAASTALCSSAFSRASSAAHHFKKSSSICRARSSSWICLSDRLSLETAWLCSNSSC